LVSRVVEVEMGYALADPATEHPDYLLEIECRPDDVSVVVTAHGRKQVPVTFDVSVADGNGGSRVVGLQLAYLLEEVTADWSPPAAPEPAPPPELPPPPPPKPPAELEAKRHPPALQWSLFASAGAVAWGPTPLWGVDGHVGAAVRLPSVPIDISADVGVAVADTSTSQGRVRAITALPGLFVRGETSISSSFALRAGAGYRAGWVDVSGEPNAGAAGSSIGGLWHGPALRLSPVLTTELVTFMLLLEGGYSLRRLHGSVYEGSDFEMRGPWLSMGLGASLEL
jgi:hypothetical protein